jgi:dienelactone hydrolase
MHIRPGIALFLLVSFSTLPSCALFIPLKADEAAMGSALSADAVVRVSDGSVLGLEPAVPEQTGFIFYPGARVDAEAYAPLLRRVAESGFPVYIVRMPFNLAVLDSDAALRVMRGHPGTKRWILSGHSLGGAMACAFAKRHPDLTAGLVLFAAYPGGGDDLSRSAIPVLSVSADLDGLATPEKVEKAKRFLPASTTYLVIKGGNHAQFGAYGKQEGDNDAVLAASGQLALSGGAAAAFAVKVDVDKGGEK